MQELNGPSTSLLSYAFSILSGSINYAGSPTYNQSAASKTFSILKGSINYAGRFREELPGVLGPRA